MGSPWSIFREAAHWKLGLTKTQVDDQEIYNISVAESERHFRELLGVSDEEV